MSKMSSVECAVSRAQQIMHLFKDAYERPADAVADFIHLCQATGQDVDQEIHLAYSYVEEEVAEEEFEEVHHDDF